VSALLDTSVIIGLEQSRLPVRSVPTQASLSVITIEELKLGLAGTSPLRANRVRTYEAALIAYTIVPVTLEIAQLCAEIRAEGRSRGVRYEPFDSLIGATARHLAVPVFTQDDGFTGMSGVDVRRV
jgi:predicted nucleic acid-binding protein